MPTNDLLAYSLEGLVTHGKDGKLEPRLASTWDISSNGKVYTFHLRNDATFQNGRPVEAADVKWTWERNCDPKVESVTAMLYLGDIKGALDCRRGKASSIAGVTAVDSHTLRVELVQPRAFFLGKLTYPVASVLCRNSVPSGIQVRGPQDIVGAGPFRMAAYVPESEVKFERFEGYFRGPAIPRMITMRIVKDPSTRVGLLRRGALDWAGLPQSDVRNFRGDGNFQVVEADRPAIFYIGMNGTVYKPFADVRVRQAFNHAVDKARIIRDVLGDVGTVADGILPPSVPHVERKLPTLGFDPAQARRLLKESGWEGRLPSLELWISDPTGDRRGVAELVVSMLRENLGVDARLKMVEGGMLIQKATKRELGFFMGSWYMDYLDPENLLSSLLSSYGQNRTNYDNPRFSALCKRADDMPNGPARMKLYAEAEDLAIRDATWIPLYHPREAIAVQKNVTGLESNAFGLLPPVNARR